MSRKDSNKIIKKANDLVESRYRFDIWETRVFAKMITLINKEDADFKTYRIYIKELQEDFGLTTNKDAYTRLKDGARRLMRRIVTISYQDEEGHKVLESPVIIGMETLVDGKSFIDVSFHPNMKPFLLQLKTQFLTYDIRNILKISSVHSIRVYELLKQYEKIGMRTFLVEDLKDILQVGDKYPKYANFKQRIVNKSQKDLIEHTDISFTFEEIKKGRSVEKIKFFIHKNPIIEAQQIEEAIEEETALTQSLRSVGITDTQKITELSESYTLDYMVATIEKSKAYFAKNKSVQNKAGYLIEALQKGYYKKELASEAKKAKQKAIQTKKEAKLEAKEKSEKATKESFQKNFAKKIAQLRAEYYNDALLELVLQSKKSNPLYIGVQKALKAQETSKILDAWVNDYLAKMYLEEIDYNWTLFLTKQKK
jgi:plasmid replication initiation protein